MKMPKKFNTYCPTCKTHTEHEVEKVKKGRSSTLTRIERQKKRSFGIGNRGKFSKVPGGDKPTKRINVRYRCLKCKKATLRPGYKVQTYDLVEE
jgi:large subunit ribosomal protein L44e